MRRLLVKALVCSLLAVKDAPAQPPTSPVTVIVDAVGPEWTRVEVLDVAGVLPRKWHGDVAQCLEAALADRRLLRDMQPRERQTVQVAECACFHHTYGPFRQIQWLGWAYRCALPGKWIQFIAPSDRQ